MVDLLMQAGLEQSQIRSELRVAVIDDDPEFRDAINQMLANNHFTPLLTPINVAGNSLEDVVERCLESDAVLLDLDLGYEMDGVQIGQSLQARQPEKWIIALSGHQRMLTDLRRDRDFRYVKAISKGKLQPDDLIITLSGLAERKVRRDLAHAESAKMLHVAAASDSTVEGQLALAGVKALFVGQLLPKARERSRALVGEFGEAPPLRYEIVLMIWSALERLSFVEGENHRRPTSGQLEELAACVDVLRRSPLTAADEREVYERVRFVGLGLGADASHIARPEELGFQPDE